MNRYQTSTPRAIVAFAAAALTAATLGVAVIVPATLDHGSAGVRTVAAATTVAPAPTEATIVPARIEVIGVRDSAVAATQDREFQGRRDRKS